MDKLKKIIIIMIPIFVMIVIIISLIIFILLKNNTGGKEDFPPEEIEETSQYSRENLSKVMTHTEFYTVSNCMQMYLDLLNRRNTYYEDEEYLDIINNSIIEILSVDYVQDNQINSENIENYIDNIEEKLIYVPIKISGIEQNDNIVSYVIYGFVENMQNVYVKDIYSIVNFDIINTTFSIEPLLNNTTEIENIEVRKITQSEIEENENNLFTYEETSQENIVKKYIDTFKKIILAKPDIAYNLLEEEYRNARFANLEEFEEYVNNNKDVIFSTRAEKYLVEKSDGNTIYTCIDQNQKYFIFIEDVYMDYKVILDNYTLEDEEDIEKYNTLSNEKKISVNIQKIIEAINNKDYNYVYKKLNNEFKNNKFPNLEEFESYVKNNFYDINILSESTAKIERNVHICNIKISNTQNETKEKTILVRLLEGTDFEISFSE